MGLFCCQILALTLLLFRPGLTQARGSIILQQTTVRSSTTLIIDKEDYEFGPLALEEVPMPETVHLTSLLQINLNPVSLLQGARMTCVAGKQGEEAYASLARCPTFQPCAGLVASGARLSESQEKLLPPVGTQLVPEGSISACSLGLTDGTESPIFPEPPMNCRSWHTKTQEEKDAAVRAVVGPRSMASLTPEWARNEALRRQPAELGCGQHKDFVPSDPLEVMVYRFQNVYIAERGGVFNDRHFFFASGCQHRVRHYQIERWPPLIKNVTIIRRVPTVINWIYHHGFNFYHGLVETFPALIFLVPILREYPDVPIIATRWQLRGFHQFLQPLLGVSKLNHYIVQKGDFVLADEVFQPLFQSCGEPSKAVWTDLRRRFLLHPQGLPVLNPDWSTREVTPLTDEQMQSIPDDWVVVVAHRSGYRRSINSMRRITSGIAGMFPPGRVVVFRGDMGVLEARNLFRRARLFVAGHGAALANMVFMPQGSSVLEIRPDKDFNRCFHALAEACSLEYNLIFGVGTHSSRVLVNATEVLDTVFALSGHFR